MVDKEPPKGELDLKKGRILTMRPTLRKLWDTRQEKYNGEGVAHGFFDQENRRCLSFPHQG